MLPQSRYNKIEKMSYKYIFIWTFALIYLFNWKCIIFPDVLKEKVINCINF